MYQKLENIISRFNSENRDLIIQAFNFAFNAHINQKRVDGEPYIVHPLEVAYILSEMNLDVNTIIGGLLHDVIEDTEFTYSDIESIFGEEVAILVEGVSKLDKLKFKSKEEAQAGNIRKMLIAMTKDIRVILIKLADRLHNMRTLKHLPEAKQIEKSEETLNIYVPLAHRLGIYKIKWELEDLAFRYLESEEYYKIAKLVSETRNEREKFTEEIIDDFNKVLEEANVSAIIEGRPKHLYSIYRKIKQKNKTIDEIFDLIAIRVIVDSIKDCYITLGLAHEKYSPITNKFKDYIAMPKLNNYQSLHTTVLSKEGKPFEIQIRTKQMHKIAELGIAAHFKYKEQSNDSDNFDEKFVWIREVLEWLTETQNPKEAMENFKIDLNFQEIYVFTPKGRVISLPIGSTPLDFAFRIHTDIGYRCEGAKVNGKMVSLDYVLETGNIVEIITSKHAKGPSIDWLNIVKSNHAKSKIRQWFNKISKEDSLSRGKYIFEKECKKRGSRFADYLTSEKLLKVSKALGYSTVDELYFNLGSGSITFSGVSHKINKFIDENEGNEDKKYKNKVNKTNSSYNKQKYNYKNEVLIKGQSNILNKFAKCCTPVYGDEIVGFITRGRGVTIHRKTCKNVTNCTDKSRFVEVSWCDLNSKKFNVDICVTFKGVTSYALENITKIVKSFNIHIRSINFREINNHLSKIDIGIIVDSKDSLEKLVISIKNLKGVESVYRPNSLQL